MKTPLRFFRTTVFFTVLFLFVATAVPAASAGDGVELVSTGHPPAGFTFSSGQVAEAAGDFMITGYEGNDPPYSAYGFLNEGVGVQTLGTIPIDETTVIPTTGYEFHSLSLTEGYAYAFSLPGGAFGLLYVRSVTLEPDLGVYAVSMVFDYRYEPALHPGMLYMRFSDGYQLEFMLQGDVSDVTSVIVTGPASSGVDVFPLNEDVGEFWAVYPSQTTFITAVFPDDFTGTYTFTATYEDNTTEAFTFDFQPDTPMTLPANVNVNEDTGMLSWDPVTGASGYYLIVFSDDYGQPSYHELYHGEDDPPIVATSFNLFDLMAGLQASLGDYKVRVVAVDGYETLGNEAYAGPVAFTYTPLAPSILGTWGAAMLTHEYDVTPPAWYAEQSRVTFNADGSGMLAGIRNDGAEEEGDRIEEFFLPFNYAVTPNPDGSFNLVMTIGDEQVLNRVILSDDGSIAFMDGTAASGEVSMAVLVRIDAEKTYDSTLEGRYYYQGFEYNEDGLEDPPGGFGRYMALSGIHEFFDTAEGGLYRTDDLGAWCNSVKIDGSNAIWYDPGEQNQAYMVSPTGMVSMGGGFFRGALAGNGRVFAGTGSYGSNNWASYLFMKQGDRVYSNADLNGKWAVVGFGQENESPEGMFFMAEIGAMTYDVSGVCQFKFRERASDGFVGVESGQITLDVAPDGSIGGWLSGGLPAGGNQPSGLIGAIGNDGNTLMLNASFDSADRREVFIAIRASSVGDLAGSAFQPDVIYMRYSGGYRLEFQLKGDMSGIEAVHVSGPDGSGTVDHQLSVEDWESWNVYPREDTGSYITVNFPEDYRGIYTFTVTYDDNATEEIYFNFQPPAEPMAVPTGVSLDENTGELSWNAVDGAAGYYLIIFSGDYGQSYSELYHGEDDVPIQATSFNLFALMAGLQADPGGFYKVQVVAVDRLPVHNRSEAYSDPVPFQYLPGGPVPDLGQAITVLKVLAGIPVNDADLEDIRDVNGDGKIGFAELLYILQTNAGLRLPLP